MPSYYNIVEGNLHTGDIAKSSDINHIQIHIQDALKALLSDMHDHQSYILGSAEQHMNDFIITPAPKMLGRYIDAYNIFEYNPEKVININRFDVRQPFPLTKTSVYSVIIKVKNTSNRDIPVECELQTIDGDLKRKSTIVIPANTEATDVEVVFDIDYFPTAPRLDFNKLMERDGKDIPPITDENSYDEGFDKDYHNLEEGISASAGVSQLYFVIKRTNLNEIDLADNDDDEVIFDPNTSLGVYYTDETLTGKNVFLETRDGVIYSKEDNSSLYYKVVYANNPTYLCSGGEAVIAGEKVLCLDNQISVAGVNENGNVLSRIYLGLDGHLHVTNSKASLTTDVLEFEDDEDDPLPMAYLPIALILSYSNVYGVAKDPLIIQDQKYGQRPLSHHERLRRLENKIDWTTDKALPSRIKYTISSPDWVDTTNGDIDKYPFSENAKTNGEDISSYYTTTDANGNLVVKLTNVPNIEVPVTLKDIYKSADGSPVIITESDVANASQLPTSKLKGMKHDIEKGILTLSTKKTTSNKEAISTSKKDAKEIDYNPWDDDEANRPTGTKYEKNERVFTVHSGKNSQSDKVSTYPAMTLYVKNNVKLKKLEIPVKKFQNCSGVKFFIWRRQDTNNKTNVVWYPLLQKKIFTSKVFSLKKAEVKGKYQYMKDGFTISPNDGEGHLNLEKGQYAIIVLPIPKSGKGSVYIETYKPKNSKDFLIGYHGAANGSYFTLYDRWQEVWYNSAKATVVEEEYEASGSAESKAITWTEKNLSRFTSVTPIIGKNLTVPTKEGCSYKLYVNTGGKWQEVTPGKENKITGGANTFAWKIEFFSKKGKATPKLVYNSKDKYAIKFILKREKLGWNTKESQKITADLNKNMCLTSVDIDGDDVLRRYLGDDRLFSQGSHFNQHEFARVWATEEENQKLLIDLQGSDYVQTFENSDVQIPLWSFNYCDLSLEDFAKINVDYTDYSEYIEDKNGNLVLKSLEDDENNLRLKLDSNHSYNDNDIHITGLSNFKKEKNEIDDSEDYEMSFSNHYEEVANNNDNDEESEEETEITPSNDAISNQRFMKMSLDNPLDLTKYTGLRFTFKVKSATDPASLSGFGIYISSQEEIDVPSNNRSIPGLDIPEENILSDASVLVPQIVPGVSSESYYEGKVIRIIPDMEEIVGDKGVNETFYQYIQEFDTDTNSYVYNLHQLHDVRTYNIFKPSTIEASTTEKEITIRVEINPNNPNYKYVREIGFISLNDEGYYNVKGQPVQLEFVSLVGISEDYYPIYNPEYGTKFEAKIDYSINTFEAKKLPFDTQGKVDTYYGKKTLPNDGYFSETKPLTSLVNIDREKLKGAQSFDKKGIGQETIICCLNNNYEGGLSNYKHFSIQLASDVYLPKDCLKVELCEGQNGEKPFVSLNVPTINCIFDPMEGNKISLTQIFKKINSDKQINSIVIKTTKRFSQMTDAILGDLSTTTTETTNGTETQNNEATNEDKKETINIFIGKIVLYKAETIPMLHKKMRFKFYSTVNGEIEHRDEAITPETISIRKIGSVLDYN